MTKYKDGERHKCDDSCQGHMSKKKRVMGTSKKGALPKEVISETPESMKAEKEQIEILEKEVEKMESEIEAATSASDTYVSYDLSDMSTTDEINISEPTWQNVAESTVLQQIRHIMLEESSFLLDSINTSNNQDAIKEARFHVEELQRKLNNIIKDKNIKHEL
jgi:pentose-5-phosphate-3-epimerase